jgi:hypothetical protein
MRVRVLLAILLVCLAGVAAEAEIDVCADIHLHTNKHLGGFSDGLEPPKLIFFGSLCRVVIFTDHLDGVIERGTDLYLQTIRALSTEKKLAIPAVEVTCGYGYQAYDVLAIGLNSQSLGELGSLYKRGAFIDPENGLPAIKLVADKYGLVLVAAHPDNSKIPFALGEHPGICNGYELFDSKLIGFTTNDLSNNLAKFYNTGATGATLTSGNDRHFILMGALPTKSLLEAPVTHILLDDGAEITEANIVESIRRGRTYAASLIGAGIMYASCVPGGTWDVARNSRLILMCKGLSERNLLYGSFAVVAGNGRETKTINFLPKFKDGLAGFAIDFAQLEMPDAKYLNVDFGGRVVTSTIHIRPANVPVVQQASLREVAEPDRVPTVAPTQPAAESIPSGIPTIALGSVYSGESYITGIGLHIDISARMTFVTQQTANLSVTIDGVERYQKRIRFGFEEMRLSGESVVVRSFHDRGSVIYSYKNLGTKSIDEVHLFQWDDGYSRFVLDLKGEGMYGYGEIVMYKR